MPPGKAMRSDANDGNHCLMRPTKALVELVCTTVAPGRAKGAMRRSGGCADARHWPEDRSAVKSLLRYRGARSRRAPGLLQLRLASTSQFTLPDMSVSPRLTRRFVMRCHRCPARSAPYARYPVSSCVANGQAVQLASQGVL